MTKKGPSRGETRLAARIGAVLLVLFAIFLALFALSLAGKPLLGSP